MTSLHRPENTSLNGCKLESRTGGFSISVSLPGINASLQRSPISRATNRPAFVSQKSRGAFNAVDLIGVPASEPDRHRLVEPTVHMKPQIREGLE